MADAFHIGMDQPGLAGVLPVPDQPYAQPSPLAPDRPNPTDPDWSNFPEARSTSKGPDGVAPPTPGPFTNFWGQHSGPQPETKPDTADVSESMTGSPSVAPPPPAPPALGPEQPGPTALPVSRDQQMQEWLHPTTPEGKAQAQDIDAAIAGFHSAWENDTIFGGLQNATSDAIGNMIEGAKAKLGVTLEDPTHGGYEDEAIQRVIAQRQAQSWGSYFNPRDPEGFFGGGAGFKAAVQKAQMDIFDEKRQALAAKIQGDQAFDRAGENSDALSLIDAGTPGAMLGAKLSHQANVAAGQAVDAAGGSLSARVGQLAGGILGGAREPVNDLLMMFGAGLEPTLAKTYFPLAPKALQIASNITEAGARQAALNMGLTLAATPEHQAANVERGEESGLVPALHDLEDAGISGFLPGAFIHGFKALTNLHGPDSKPWIDEFIRQAKGDAPDPVISPASRSFMDAVHEWERSKGLPEGSTYAAVDERLAALRAEQAARAGKPPPEPPLAGARAAPAPEPESPGGAPRLLEGPTRAFPKSPDLPPSARNRPSASSITPEAVQSAEADATAMPPALPGTPPSEHLRVYTEAVRHGEAPDVMAPPEPPMSAPPAADANFLPPDHLPQQAASAGVVHRTTGYEGPHADLVQNRIEHLQRQLENPDLPRRTQREFERRIRDFSAHIENRNAALSAAGVPEDRAAAIRGIQPGDVITGETEDGRTITGEISGWGPHTVGINDENDIHHDVKPETITKIAKGARSGSVNNVPQMARGEVFAHSGKPVTAGETFPAKSLHTDAATYQYKRGGDANGVTERLQTVKQWSPLSVGNIVVHERRDGNLYIVDGHQRLGLANRIEAANPGQNISLPGFLFKEADGWTPNDVRAEAAAKNIREGLGDTLDIARILRDKPEMWDDSLPIGRGDMKEARGLANLSDEAWGMAVNGKPRSDYASFVGNMAEDKSTHLAIMDDLVKFEPRTQNEARMIIADAMQAGFNKTQQEDLFGKHEVTESLRGERSKVYAAAERLLTSDKKIFGMLNDEAPRIIEAGNILADTNADRADRAGQLAQGLITLAQRAGPVSAALNRAAQRVADGEAPKTAARTFLNELPALLNDEGLRIADVARPPTYDLDKPKGREEQVQDLEAEFMATQPGFFGEAPKTPEEQRAAIQADVSQKLIDAGMPEVQADANAAIVAARYATRAARMGRADPEQMYRETGMVVRGDAQREAAVAGEAPSDAQVFNQPATVPTFYSAVERAVEGAKQAKATPDQWLAMIKNMPGIKPEELQWLGIADWLKSQTGSVTKQAVGDYVRANSIQVTEALRSGSANDEHLDVLTELNDEYAEMSEEVNRLGSIANATPMDSPDLERVHTEYRAAVDALKAKERQIREAEGMPLGPTKYESYKLPGGENYRELLLTLPGAGRPLRQAAYALNDRMIEKYGDMTTALEQMTEGENEEFSRVHGAASQEAKTDKSREDYKSSHWDEPNVLAHIRFDDRTSEGKRALHLAEVQSDWHQAGRKKGYKPVNPDPMEQRPFGEVPDAPFKTTWPELSLKRMIRYAAENGYDRLTWDTGDTNAERYDLSKQISRVRWITHPSLPVGRGTIDAFDHDGEEVISRQAGEEDLPDIVGKEVADRLLQSEVTKVTPGGASHRELSGLDLKVGGEGMTGFYDKILPATVAKLTKKFGGKVGEAPIGVANAIDLYAGPEPSPEEFEKIREMSHKSGAPAWTSPITGQRLTYSINRVSVSNKLDDISHAMKDGMSFTEAMSRFGSRDVAEIFGGVHERMDFDRNQPVHSLDITPQLREAAVNEGFPLFQGAPKGAEEPRGRIAMRDNSAVIDLFSKANASTFMHESGHLWLNELAEDAANPDAPQQIKDDFQEVLDWLGAKDAASISEKQHEQFARGFEQYVREGKAPSSALQRAFDAFKEWLKAIYRSLIGLGKEIPDNIRAVMDRMIATDEEIAAQRAPTSELGVPAEPKANESRTQTVAPQFPTGDTLVDHVLSDPYVASAIADPVINRANDVPYGAGPNVANDRVVNIDRHVPKTDTIKGVKYDPARAVAVHEQVEKHVLDQLTAAGVPENEAYEAAHFVFAEPAERAWVEANVGPNAWDLYQKHWDKWLKPIDHENPANPPPDLYQKPYPHDDDHLAPEDRGSDKAFEETGHRNLPELRAIAERALGGQAIQGAVEGGRMGDLEGVIRGAAHEAAVAAKASPDPLDRQIGEILEREVAPLIDEAFPPATEAGPEGTQQTLMPGVEPVTDAARARVGAAAPLRGGNAAPPAGGLFDDLARMQRDLYDSVPTEDGLIPRDDLETKVPLETALAKFVNECGD